MKTHVAEWLATWAEAPVGTARLVIAAALFLLITLSVGNFVTNVFCTVVQTAMELAHYDQTAAVNLVNRADQVRGLHADIDKLSAQCARR